MIVFAVYKGRDAWIENNVGDLGDSCEKERGLRDIQLTL